MIATTLAGLVDRVKRDATLGSDGPTYTLATAYTAGGTTMDFAQPPGNVGLFSTLSIDSSMYLVTAVNENASQVTVIPNYHGTVSTNHDIGDIVEADARFPRAALVDWAHLEILSWGSKLWRIRTQDLAVDPSEATYELTLQDAADDVLFLLDARQEPSSQTVHVGDRWWSEDRWPHFDARLLRNMSPHFASGYGIQFINRPTHTSTMRVWYATKFDLDPFDLSTDLVSGVGLRASQIDLLEHGVRWRALASPMGARTDWRAAGMSRDSEEVNVLDIIRTADMARSMRDQSLAHEANELRREFPYRQA